MSTELRTREPPDLSSKGRAWAKLSRGGGVAALILGVAGLVLGVGIGLRWLQVGAVGGKSIAATFGLVGGVGLTALGVTRLSHGLRLVGRVLVASALVLLVAVLVWTLSPAVIATNVPPIPFGSPTPDDLDLEAREVRFPAADGTDLWAWYIEPIDGAIVVLRHGAGSTAEDVLPHAAVLAANGYGVLITDARGHGRSEGPAMDFGWHGSDDIEGAVTFLVGLPEVDPERIAVVGMSMGGEEAIGSVGVDDRIAAVVAEGATARTESDKVWLVDEYGWRGWLQVRLEWLQYSFSDLLTSADRPPSLATAAAAAAPRPILLITGAEAPDEGKAAEYIRADSEANISIWTVPGAGHIQGLSVAPDEWEQRVVGFLDDAMGEG